MYVFCLKTCDISYRFSFYFLACKIQYIDCFIMEKYNERSAIVAISVQLLAKEVQFEVACLHYEYSKNFITIVNNQLCMRFKTDRVSCFEYLEIMVQSSIHVLIVVLI